LISRLLGLTAGFLFAVSSTLVRVGLEYSTPQRAVFITLLMNVLLVGSIALTAGLPSSLDPAAIALFALAGVLAPAAAMLLNYLGISKLGVVVNQPVLNLHPLFAAFFAFFMLHESVPSIAYASVLLIVVGMLMLTYRGREAATSIKALERRFIALPLTAALLIGLSHNLRKLGLMSLNAPVFGAFVNLLASLALASLVLLLRAGRLKLRWSGLKVCRPSRGTSLFMLSGAASGVGLLLSFFAYSFGQVTIVAPLISLEPLFVVLISYLFLKGYEVITWLRLVGIALLLSGVWLIMTA
jgi:drug/metabolite transporter (DMT)-like permease